jgi:signal transduction histidine kinase/ActR/RegA family two-component response regulator
MKAWRDVFRVRHPRKGEIWLEGHSVPRREPDGSTLWHGFVQDVTERKHLESQLRQAQKLEAIGQLAGGVAHDFNNILAVIMMHVGLLQMNPNLDDGTRHALKDLEAGARRAANLTRQLLMFSRRSVLKVKPLEVNDVVETLLKMLRRLIGEQIDLRFDGKSALPLVEADAGMLEQVIMNLVVNARDALPKGGRITISTALADVDAIHTEAQPNSRPGRFVCLAVSDTGCGMDAATQKRIFEPFFTTKDAGRGTGLGLATVHGIVAQHKGWVEVDSELDVGTAFRVYLPVTAQAPSNGIEPPQAGSVRRGRETILLVEDEPPVRQVVGKSLRALGYQVFEAANGQEAMALWQIHGRQVDLLLTDMVMPEGMTGLELAEQLQALKPGLKAIISSGYSAEIVHVGVPSKAGIVYLPKPYATNALADAIRDCLDQKK